MNETKIIYSRIAKVQFQDSFARLFPEFNDYIGDNKDDMVVKNITFVTTEQCQLRCTYCYQCDKKSNFMSIETAKKAIDALFDKEKMNGYITDYNKCAIIEFIGGEPLLNMDVVEFICEYFLYKAAELNHPWLKYHMFSFTSNGINFKTERVQKWLNRYKNRISIGITIDGDKTLHDSCRLFPDGKGSYDIVVESVKDGIANFGLNSSKVTFAPENISKINVAIPHLIELGLTDIHANCVYENVWRDEHAPIFFNELIKLADYFIDNDLYTYAFCSIFDESIGHPMEPSDNKNWCGGIGDMLAIAPDGRCFPCIRYRRYSLTKSKEQPIGDVDTKILSLEESPFLLELSKITRRSQSTDECFNCSVASGCSLCSAYNYDINGTANKRCTYICKMHKARVAANYYYWNKLYKKLNLDEKFEMNLNEEDLKLVTGGNENV